MREDVDHATAPAGAQRLHCGELTSRSHDRSHIVHRRRPEEFSVAVMAARAGERYDRKARQKEKKEKRKDWLWQEGPASSTDSAVHRT